MSEFIKLYRAVSVQELADLKQSGELRPVPTSIEGKWFAENPADAREWGLRFYQEEDAVFQIVEVEILASVADLLFRLPQLDNIGPARFANLEQLAMINKNKLQIREIFWEAAGET